MKMNKEWHLKHKMPKNPTLQERIAWHLAHAENCRCRPIPAGILAKIKEAGLK